MLVDPNEMRIQARVLRREAAEFEDIAAMLRVALPPETMVGPAADRMRQRLVQRAAGLKVAAVDVLMMASTLERSAAELEQRGAFGG